MKKILFFFLLSAATTSYAQVKLTKQTAASIKPDIEKVARDYYAHFHYTMGEKIAENENSIEYKSTVTPQGAARCVVVQYKSAPNDYSWQAEMLRTDDFAKASAKYKQLFKQLNGTTLAMHDGKTYKLKGDFDDPDEGRGFSSSLLHLDVKEKDLLRLKVEVAINYTMPDWIVNVMVYEKDDDEDIRPTDKN